MDKKSLYAYIARKSTRTPTKPMTSDITRVTNNVYMGSYDNAINVESWPVKFKYIINASMMKYALSSADTVVINIPVPDNTTVDLKKYFDSVATFLEKCEKSASPVLVHCVAGINRSGAMVMAYLLHTRCKAVPVLVFFLYAYHGLKDARGMFLENPSFRRQLVDHYF